MLRILVKVSQFTGQGRGIIKFIQCSLCTSALLGDHLSDFQEMEGTLPSKGIV